MNIGKTILILMIIGITLMILHPSSRIPIEKSCRVDADCFFVKTRCCPSCTEGVESINVNYTEEFSVDCDDTACPPLYCESDYGESYQAYPACINNACSSRDELQCSTVCVYWQLSERHPFNVYVGHTAEKEGLSDPGQLAIKCGC